LAAHSASLYLVLGFLIEIVMVLGGLKLAAVWRHM